MTDESATVASVTIGDTAMEAFALFVARLAGT